MLRSASFCPAETGDRLPPWPPTPSTTARADTQSLPENAPTPELRQSLEAFIRYRQDHLTGDEKGEAQVFLDRLFIAFGHSGVHEAGAKLEKRLTKHDEGGTAFADLVWKPRVLIEMKKAGVNLAKHYRQAFDYWLDLTPDRPLYVILCNFDELWIYDLNRQLEEPVDKLALEDLPRRWEALAFMLPRQEAPAFGNDLVAVTRESAAKASGVFNRLLYRGVDRDAAQRFILQSVMAMFSEDIGLLPRHSFTKAVEDCLDGASAYDLLSGLFREMDTPGVTAGGRFQGTPYFNGGLFQERSPLELTREELEQLHDCCKDDWAQVRPAIFGTLFEQSLDKSERHAFGAYFTSEADIQKVVMPTIVRPWREKIDRASTVEELHGLAEELLNFRVLDPACGSGNFLYIAYRELRRIERALSDKIVSRRRRRGAEDEMRMSYVSNTQFFGIDVRPFAIEVAKVTLMLGRKLAADELGDERSVLPLADLDGNFQAADAIFTPWPAFDVCIGNPPYLGRRRIVTERGAAYSSRLQAEYPDIGGVSDYVVYWFRKAHDLLPINGRAGLVGTNTVRQGDTRKHSLDYITEHDGVIYDAVASQPWSGDATVEVSIVNWTKELDPGPKTLWLADGSVRIHPDHISGSLSAELDADKARRLAVNWSPKVCFQGQTTGHTPGFVLSPEQAHAMAQKDPLSALVLYPYLDGDDLNNSSRPRRFVIDIEADDTIAARAGAPEAFAHVKERVLPHRQARADKEAEDNKAILLKNPNARVNWHHRNFLDKWWQLAWRRSDMLAAVSNLPRYIALSIVAVENRPSIYAFVSPGIHSSHAVQVFAFSDDYSFGILHSHVHRVWFQARCSTMRHDLRYTANTVFTSFPWPQAPSDKDVAGVVAAVVDLLELRDERVARGTSLGKLYASLRVPGRNPLRNLLEVLDRAVVAAYGFDPAEDLLAQVLALNEDVATAEAKGRIPRAPGNAGLLNTQATTSMISAPRL